MHPGVHGIGPSHDRGVRRQRYWHGGKCIIETRSAGGESVNIWSMNVFVAIASQVIGTQGINRDQDYVGLRMNRASSLAWSSNCTKRKYYKQKTECNPCEGIHLDLEHLLEIIYVPERWEAPFHPGFRCANLARMRKRFCISLCFWLCSISAVARIPAHAR